MSGLPSAPPSFERPQRQGRVEDVDGDKRGEPGVRVIQRHQHKLQTPPGIGGVRSWSLTPDGRQRRDLGFGRADPGSCQGGTASGMPGVVVIAPLRPCRWSGFVAAARPSGADRAAADVNVAVPRQGPRPDEHAVTRLPPFLRGRQTLKRWAAYCLGRC